ncbi:MAG: L,D-transpeptidase family protein [Sedimentisphaerales bacterium]|nr:L,D-transpeptidase family protein [Sedimentisphaerales bacterium]
MKRIYIFTFLLGILAFTLLFVMKIKHKIINSFTSGYSVTDRIEQYGSKVHVRLRPHFESAGVNYPPDEVILVGLKQEKMLEVWARNRNTDFKKIREYPILGSSGVLGPKLREGDKQVPEGIYRIESLNPNSRFHLSLRLNYPNEFDLQHAEAEGRTQPGGDIMIHGSSVSVGCLAMGNEAIEELFVIAAETGIKNIKVVLAPVDFRKTETPQNDTLPIWTNELYSQIREELRQLEP